MTCLPAGNSNEIEIAPVAFHSFWRLVSPENMRRYSWKEGVSLTCIHYDWHQASLAQDHCRNSGNQAPSLFPSPSPAADNLLFCQCHLREQFGRHHGNHYTIDFAVRVSLGVGQVICIQLQIPSRFLLADQRQSERPPAQKSEIILEDCEAISLHRAV